MQLPERVHGVKLLLGSLDDPYPTPQGALRPDSGPSPSRYIPCETCRSTGRVRVRGGFALCLVCGGGGERRREHGDRQYDAYMRLSLDDAVALPVEIPPSRPQPDGEEAYGWERAQQAQDRQGSYRELRRHLDWLRQAHPRWHSLIKACLIEHQERELGPRAALEMELGVLALTLRMKSVRVPRWLREPARAPEQSVAVLASRGLKAGEIARALGMTKKAVRRQLKRIDSRQAGVPIRAT